MYYDIIPYLHFKTFITYKNLRIENKPKLKDLHYIKNYFCKIIIRHNISKHNNSLSYYGMIVICILYRHLPGKFFINIYGLEICMDFTRDESIQFYFRF